MALNSGTPTPVTTPLAAVEPLACGRDAALVWDHVADDRLDAHERDCPHCAAATADVADLDRLVHRLAAEPLEPPPGVLERVVGAALAELRPGGVLELESPHGPAAVATAAAAAVLRGVVDAMAGLRARSCRIVPLDGPGPRPVAVTMTVVARFGTDFATATARVRQMVVAAGEQALGLPVARVDIEVVDVYDEPRPLR